MRLKIVDKRGDFYHISSEEFTGVFSSISEYYEKLKCGFTLGRVKGLIFIEKDDFFLQEDISDHSGSDYEIDETVYKENNNNIIRYYAAIDGYLSLDRDVLKIVSPFYETQDLMKLYLIMLPVESGMDSLKNYLFSRLREMDIYRELNFNIMEGLILKEGITPTPGANGKLLIHSQPMETPPEDESGNIDYKLFNPFILIDKGVLVAEQIPSIPGIPGMDLYGKEIRVPVVTDIEFTIGENVISEKMEDGIIRYISSTAGVVHITSHSLCILEDLIIDGDVGLETGNIDYAKNVIIHGNITPEFSVNCGGNLEVFGSIDNGAVIYVHGNAEIRGGIIGEGKSFKVQGHLTVDYIQDSIIRVDGDIFVINSIYNSKVFSGGSLSVIGKKNKSLSHGSVVGGEISSMKYMTLHSAGSISSATNLICGIDIELEEKIDQLKESLPVFNSKIVSLQKRIGFDLSRGDIKDKLKGLKEYDKKNIRKLLLDLKDVLGQREKILNYIEKSKESIINYNDNEKKIKIEKFIFEDTKIILGRHKKIIDKKQNGRVFYIEDNRVLSTSL